LTYHTINNLFGITTASVEKLMTEEKIESTLKGNTLRVYWFLLKTPNELVGARETQRALKFSVQL